MKPNGWENLIVLVFADVFHHAVDGRLAHVEVERTVVEDIVHHFIDLSPIAVEIDLCVDERSDECHRETLAFVFLHRMVGQCLGFRHLEVVAHGQGVGIDGESAGIEFLSDFVCRLDFVAFRQIFIELFSRGLAVEIPTDGIDDCQAHIDGRFLVGKTRKPSD